MFRTIRRRYGPYSPSERLSSSGFTPIRRPFDAGVVAVDEALEGAPLIDWVAAGAAKFARWRRLFDTFDQVDTPLLRGFELFVTRAARPCPACSVRGRADAGSDAITFSCNGSTAELSPPRSRPARAAGMAYGLIKRPRDRHGPRRADHAWARPVRLLMGRRRRAPDAFTRTARNWGLHRLRKRWWSRASIPPRHPARARAHAERRAHRSHQWLMRCADPARQPAARAPISPIRWRTAQLLALDRTRHRAVVIGVDLGSCRPGFRSRLRRAGIRRMDDAVVRAHALHFRKPSRLARDA